jgi:hypothetical protein
VLLDGDIFPTLLTDLRDAVLRAYSSAGDPPPEIRISAGLRATVDIGEGCADRIWLILQQVIPSTIAGGEVPCLVMPQAVLTVDLQRCWPTLDQGGRVDVKGEETAALRIARDASILWYGLMAQRQDGTLFSSFVGLDCEAVRPGQTIPVGPLGGSAGFQLPIRVDISGARRPTV